MPLIKSPLLLPAWGELKDYEIKRLSLGESFESSPERAYDKELWIVCEGKGEWRIGDRAVLASSGDRFELKRDERTAIAKITALEHLVLVRLSGSWDEEVGGSGVFTTTASEVPGNPGDPADYARNTDFDNHYHDCDEYYIIYGGIGVVVSEGKPYIVSAGDCIATGMGHHHDIPLIVEPLKGVFFETTLRGKKRRGHLWAHTHGTPEPDPYRC